MANAVVRGTAGSKVTYRNKFKNTDIFNYIPVDESGNLIGVSVDEKNIIQPLEKGDFNLSDGDVALVNEKTESLQEKAPTADVLIEARKKAFFKLLAIDKNICSYFVFLKCRNKIC